MANLIKKLGYKHIHELSKPELEAKFRSGNYFSAFGFYVATGITIFTKHYGLGLTVAAACCPVFFEIKFCEAELQRRKINEICISRNDENSDRNV